MLFIHTCIAISYLHTTRPKIIHRDLKPANIMLDDKGFIKVIDFGLAETKSSSASGTNLQVGGTLLYQPPECFKYGSKISSKVDNYAFGILVNEVCSSEVPYTKNDPPVPPLQIPDAVKQGIQPKLSSTLTDMLLKIVKSCLSQNPQDRMEFTDIEFLLECETRQEMIGIPIRFYL